MQFNTKPIISYIKTIFTYFGASLIPMILSIATNPLIALNMSPYDYAVVGYFTSFQTLISPIIVFYMIHYYSKRFFETNDRQRLQLKAIIFKSLIFFSFLVSIICLILILCYIKLFNANLSFPIFPYLAMMVFSIPLTGIYNLELTDSKMGRNSKHFFNTSVTVGIILVITNLLFVAALKMGAFGKLLAPLVTNLLVFLYLLKRHSDLFKIKNSFSEFKQIFKFCWPLATGAMLGYFSNGFDKTYLESIGDVNEYGYYIVGSQIANYLSVFGTAIFSTFQPDIYESIATHNKIKLLRTCILLIGLASIVVSLFILLCPFLINILTAGRYIESTPYARIISLSTITSAIYYIMNDCTIAIGKPKLYLYTTIIGSILIILCFPLVANQFQYIGGAYMVSGSFILLTIVNALLLLITKQKSFR